MIDVPIALFSVAFTIWAIGWIALVAYFVAQDPYGKGYFMVWGWLWPFLIITALLYTGCREWNKLVWRVGRWAVTRFKSFTSR